MSKKFVALITGGSRGIGKACAIALAQAGHDIAINYRSDLQSALETQKEIRSLGRRAEIYQANMGKSEEINQMINSVLNDFGRIDVLVHNAGTGNRVQFSDLTPDIWNETIEINLNSAYHILKAVLPEMQKQNYGKVILMSSLAAKTGGVSAAYAASKNGLVALAKYLVQEYGQYNININAVGPGFVETELLFGSLKSKDDLISMQQGIPMRRLAKPSDIAGVVTFLASESSSYVNGECIYVSGGR